MNAFSPISWSEVGDVVMLDQTLLPTEERYRTYETPEGVADAIRRMVIRGAPAIGIAAAMGIAMGMRRCSATSLAGLREEMTRLAALMADTRPTAVNLFWAIERMGRCFTRLCDDDPAQLREALIAEATAILGEDLEINRRMGAHGALLLRDGMTVLTHCNAGALATGGYGTALGVIRAAVENGLRIQVFADETRPFLQGSRLTAWELMRDGIDVTLITDSMAGHFMQQGAIDAVIVGTDRTVANGDVANKIGTYTVAVLANAHGVPFYVAAPTSTIDLSIATGAEIPIEERDGDEVRQCFGVLTAPAGVAVRNPAFDVTPSRLVTAIITENGVAYPPYERSLASVIGTK